MIKPETMQLSEGYWSPFSLTNDDQEYPKVNGELSFTQESFNLKAVVKDLHFKDGDRSWRYGDGFLINFITETHPDIKPSSQWYAYGFSIIAGKRQSVLVGHSGTYYLRYDDIKPEIEIDEKNHEAFYDIEIPWSKLAPFHPLIDKTLGINIRYNSQNDDESTLRLQLVEDEHFESELVAEKRYQPLLFLQSDKSKIQFAFEFINNIISSPETSVRVSIYSEEKQDTSLTIRLLDDALIYEKVQKLELNKGLQTFTVQLSIPNKTGLYTLDAGLEGRQWSQQFYKLLPDELPKINDYIETFEKRAKTPIELNSLNGLTYKFDDFKKSLDEHNPREQVTSIKTKMDELKVLYNRLQEYGHIYTEGRIRTAFKSPDDETLQPYSIVLPPDFDPESEYKLLYCLHGSGVDEVRFLSWVLSFREAFCEDYMFVAPRGRDLSDWYVGQTERDMLHLLGIIRDMFGISRSIIFGFSMGGYGVWRTTFLHPDFFDAAIVGSGSPKSPWRDKPEMDVRPLIENAQHIPYLVMHGTEDRAVDFAIAKEFADQLAAEGFNIEFQAFEGAGHGNYDPKDVIIEWMKKYG